ncbi:MAG: CHAT domain-containing protein [Bacteroidales bacterium]
MNSLFVHRLTLLFTLIPAILFAGANRSWKGEENLGSNLEDGILTAYEASQIYLPNTQLVVLSACETGLGEIKGSEGVFGLQRAFKGAGAEYLLMSLWQVPDKETAEFMEQFYSKLFKTQDIEQSFKQTQKEMREKYKDEPFKWAAFVLVR